MSLQCGARPKDDRRPMRPFTSFRPTASISCRQFAGPCLASVLIRRRIGCFRHLRKLGRSRRMIFGSTSMLCTRRVEFIPCARKARTSLLSGLGRPQPAVRGIASDATRFCDGTAIERCRLGWSCRACALGPLKPRGVPRNARPVPFPCSLCLRDSDAFARCRAGLQCPDCPPDVTQTEPAAAQHPDHWAPGLRASFSTLSRKKVSRAVDPIDVLRVALRHNLRQQNTDHRHRGAIDSARTPLNRVVVGPAAPEVAVQIAESVFDAFDIALPSRVDGVVAIELVIQAPSVCDETAFWDACLQWTRATFQHVLSAVVHHDQKRAHMHVLILPVLDGRLAGSELQRGDYGRPRLNASLLQHLRGVLNIRADRPGKSLEALALSAGKGPKTHAEAARRDAALMRATGAGLADLANVHGCSLAGGSTSAPTTSRIAQPSTTPDRLKNLRALLAMCADSSQAAAPLPTRPCPFPPSAARFRRDESFLGSGRRAVGALQPAVSTGPAKAQTAVTAKAHCPCESVTTDDDLTRYQGTRHVAASARPIAMPVRGSPLAAALGPPFAFGARPSMLRSLSDARAPPSLSVPSSARATVCACVVTLSRVPRRYRRKSHYARGKNERCSAASRRVTSQRSCRSMD